MAVQAPVDMQAAEQQVEDEGDALLNQIQALGTTLTLVTADALSQYSEDLHALLIAELQRQPEVIKLVEWMQSVWNVVKGHATLQLIDLNQRLPLPPGTPPSLTASLSNSDTSNRAGKLWASPTRGSHATDSPRAKSNGQATDSSGATSKSQATDSSGATSKSQATDSSGATSKSQATGSSGATSKSQATDSSGATSKSPGSIGVVGGLHEGDADISDTSARATASAMDHQRAREWEEALVRLQRAPFDSVVAAVNWVHQHRDLLVEQGEDPEVVEDAVQRVAGVLRSVVAGVVGAEEMSNEDREQLLQQWCAAYNFRQARNLQAAHPLSGMSWEPLLVLLKRAAELKHSAIETVSLVALHAHKFVEAQKALLATQKTGLPTLPRLSGAERQDTAAAAGDAA